MTNDFTDDYPRCDFCGKTLFFLDGLYRCPEESSLGWHRETIERKGSPKTPETLTELRRLLDCSSKLPWECYRPHFASGYHSITASDGQTVAVEAGEYDAELIAAAINALPALLDAADELDELRGVESRLCLLLCDLTGGLLSKATYPVPTMVAAIEEHLSECHESDLKDERDALAAKVEAVRALHKSSGDAETQGYTGLEYGYISPYCMGEVASDEYGVPWPCETIRAIDGAES